MLDQRLLLLAATLCVLTPSWSAAEKSSFFGEAATNRSVSFPAASAVEERGPVQPEGRNLRQGKNLLDFLGLGVDENTDPYLARANSLCFNGDLAECFKSRALASLDDFFDKPVYSLTDNARIVRMPGTQLRKLVKEPFEFSTEPRGDEPEWDQLLKFVLRKVRQSPATSASVAPHFKILRQKLTPHSIFNFLTPICFTGSNFLVSGLLFVLNYKRSLISCQVLRFSVFL